MRAIGALPPTSSRRSSTARADSWYLKYPAQSVSEFHASWDTRVLSGRTVPVVVALDAAEYVDDRMRAEAPLEFALDSGNVRRNRRSHDLLVPARKDRLDAQVGGSRHEREIHPGDLARHKGRRLGRRGPKPTWALNTWGGCRCREAGFLRQGWEGQRRR